MSTNYAEIADHLTVSIIDGINMKNAEAVRSGNFNKYRPIKIQEVIDIYGSIYHGIKEQIKEDN